MTQTKAIASTNGTTPPQDLDTAAPPYTAAMQQSLEQWHAVHAQNKAIMAENERLRTDNYVLQSRIDWLEQQCQIATVTADRYKASNVEVATITRAIQQLFNSAVQRIVDGEHAPQQTLVPIALRGSMTAEEAEDSIRKIAENFGAGRAPQGDGQISK